MLNCQSLLCARLSVLTCWDHMRHDLPAGDRNVMLRVPASGLKAASLRSCSSRVRLGRLPLPRARATTLPLLAELGYALAGHTLLLMPLHRHSNDGYRYGDCGGLSRHRPQPAPKVVRAVMRRSFSLQMHHANLPIRWSWLRLIARAASERQ